MGFFGKRRYGKFAKKDELGRVFSWCIEDVSSFPPGSELDSENLKSFCNVFFHLRLTFSEDGDIGLFLHYKKIGIPKYSYYIRNVKGEVMRQQTAHTIPESTERCGHWNICGQRDLREFVGTSDKLEVVFIFDDDTIKIQRLPESNSTSVEWIIPRMLLKNLNPFSSNGFRFENSLLVCRLDIKKVSGSGTIGPYSLDLTTDFIFFVFCRNGAIPPHSISATDSKGKVLAFSERKAAGVMQTLVIPKSVLLTSINMEDSLHVIFDFLGGGNPLDSLNTFNLAGPPTDARNDSKEARKGASSAGKQGYLQVNNAD